MRNLDFLTNLLIEYSFHQRRLNCVGCQTSHGSQSHHQVCMGLTDKAYYFMKSALFLKEFNLITEEEYEYLLDRLENIIENLDTLDNFYFFE